MTKLIERGHSGFPGVSFFVNKILPLSDVFMD